MAHDSVVSSRNSEVGFVEVAEEINSSKKESQYSVQRGTTPLIEELSESVIVNHFNDIAFDQKVSLETI